MPEDKDLPGPSASDAAEAPPREGTTSQFSLKVESWMTDIAGDFAPADAPAPDLAAVTPGGEPVEAPLAAPSLEGGLFVAALTAPEPPAAAPVVPARSREKSSGRARGLFMALLVLVIGVEAWLSWGASLRARLGF